MSSSPHKEGNIVLPTLPLSLTAVAPPLPSAFDNELGVRSARLARTRERNIAAAHFPLGFHDADMRRRDALAAVIALSIPPTAPPLPKPSAFMLKFEAMIAKAKLPFIDAATMVTELILGGGAKLKKSLEMTVTRDAALIRDAEKRMGADRSTVRFARADGALNVPLVFLVEENRGDHATEFQKHGTAPGAPRFAAPGKACYLWEPLGGLVGNHEPSPMRTVAKVRILPREFRAERLLLANSDAARSPYHVWYRDGNGRRLLKRGNDRGIMKE